MSIVNVKLTTALNFSKFSKNKIFCHLIPSDEFESYYSFEELNNGLNKNGHSNLISIRNATNERGLEEKVWGCDFKNYETLLKAVDRINHINLNSKDMKDNKDNKEIKDKKDVKDNKDKKNKLVNIEIIPLPRNVEYAADMFENMKIDIPIMDKFIISQIGETIWNKLHPHQKECVRFCIARSCRVEICDTMGLGKTMEAIALALFYHKEWPCLILCPAKCSGMWKNEFIKLCGSSIDPDYIEIISGSANLKGKGKKITRKNNKSEKKSGKRKINNDDTDDESSDDNNNNNISTYKDNKDNKKEKDNKEMKQVKFTPLKEESSDGKQEIIKPLITIMSYQLFVNCEEIILSRGYNMIIVDEAHAIRSHESKRTIAVTNFIKRCKYAILLSGTMCMKSKEVFPSINALYPRIFPDFFAFANRYCDPKTKEIWAPGGCKKEITTYDGCTLANELHIVLKSLLMIRRTKEDIKNDEKYNDGGNNASLDIPPLTRTHFTLNPDKKQAQKIQKQMEKVKDLIDTIVVDKDMNQDYGKNNAFMEAYRKISKIKSFLCQGYVEEYLTTKLKPGEKMLIFGHHKDMLSAIQEVLERINIGYIKIDGSVKSDEASELVKIFQTDPCARVGLLSITSAGSGLTLTAASICLFCELHPSTLFLLQSESRAHRIGQTKPVHCIYLIMPNSIEEVIWQMTNRKLMNLTNIVDGKIQKFKAQKVVEDDSDNED